MVLIKPQAGFQEQFLASPADIVIGGGVAGAGKTYALLMEPLRHRKNGKFGSVIFRRTMPMVKTEGGLWDTSEDIYLNLKNPPKPYQTHSRWVFDSGARLKFSHLQYEKNKFDYQGAQIPLIGFDELTHFSKSMFFYMLTRNRSMCGVKPYVRCTTNPQGHGWVKDLISWWIYPDDYERIELRGMPIPERAGVVRYLSRYKTKYVWGSTPYEVVEKIPNWDINKVKSITFVPGTLSDNKVLLKTDKGYEANLLAQDEETILRLWKGSWAKYTKDDLKIYNYKALQDMFSNTFIDGGERYMTCDIALEGSDKFVIVIWSGMRIERIYSYDKTQGDEIVRIMKELSQKHSIPRSNIAYDADGVGGFLKGYFKTAYNFVNNSKALNFNKQPQRYENLKTQCYYMLRKFINEWAMYIDEDIEHNQDLIIEELYAVEKRDMNSKKQLRINSKDEVKAEIKRSPDYADAIMMRMVFFLDGVKKKKAGRRSASY